MQQQWRIKGKAKLSTWLWGFMKPELSLLTPVSICLGLERKVAK